MDILTVSIIAGGLLLYSIVSGRLQGTIVTAPLVFVIFGIVVGAGGLGVVDMEIGHEVIHFVAELTLILVLFTDAARIELRQVRRDHNLPVRMLLIGLPLAIVFGTLAATQLFPGFSIWEAVLLATLLAPTDAALGQAVVSAKIVPVRIRQAINVESGLNDGIALPAVLLFAAFASGSAETAGASEWLKFGLLQVTLGPLVGAAVGLVGARLLDKAVDHEWVGESYRGVAVISLAVLTFVLAELVGGNGFIAAFVGGMVFGNSIRHPCTALFEFMETEGQLLMLITFFFFGATLLPEGLMHLSAVHFVYAALSLTLIRMIPIAISLVGSGLRLPSVLFLGWFGPRGLASILFVLLIVDEAQIAQIEELLSVTFVTVALSVLLHGVTAAPLAKHFGKRAARMGSCAENEVVGELPLRAGESSGKKGW